MKISFKNLFKKKFVEVLATMLAGAIIAGSLNFMRPVSRWVKGIITVNSNIDDLRQDVTIIKNKQKEQDSIGYVTLRTFNNKFDSLYEQQTVINIELRSINRKFDIVAEVVGKALQDKLKYYDAGKNISGTDSINYDDSLKKNEETLITNRL